MKTIRLFWGSIIISMILIISMDLIFFAISVPTNKTIYDVLFIQSPIIAIFPVRVLIHYRKMERVFLKNEFKHDRLKVLVKRNKSEMIISSETEQIYKLSYLKSFERNIIIRIKDNELVRLTW